MLMFGQSLLMSVENMTISKQGFLITLCHRLQICSEVEFKFRNILLFEHVDTFRRVSKCSSAEFQQARD